MAATLTTHRAPAMLAAQWLEDSGGWSSPPRRSLRRREEAWRPRPHVARAPGPSSSGPRDIRAPDIQGRASGQARPAGCAGCGRRPSGMAIPATGSSVPRSVMARRRGGELDDQVARTACLRLACRARRARRRLLCGALRSRRRDGRRRAPDGRSQPGTPDPRASRDRGADGRVAARDPAGFDSRSRLCLRTSPRPPTAGATRCRVPRKQSQSRASHGSRAPMA